MVNLCLRFGCPKCYGADELDKAFLVDLTQAFFATVHGPYSLEQERLIATQPENYRV